MFSTPKKRPKLKGKASSNSRFSSPSSITSESSLRSIVEREPPLNLFPSKGDFLRLIAVLAIATSVAVGCNLLATLLANRQPKPFCDSEVDFPDSLSDFCEPCPSNGECHLGKLECARGYRKHGNLCIEDGDINEAAKKLSEWIEFRLCKAHAQFLCDGIGTVWVEQDDIWNALEEHNLMEHVPPDSAIYSYTKEKTTEFISKVLETRNNSQGVKELRCPDMLAQLYKPFSCCLRQWISNNALIILAVCVVLVGCGLLLWKARQRHYVSKRVEELYQQVCDILEENALGSKRVSGECEPWVVASRLRDHLLLPKERKHSALWKKVEELVQEDSRIDRYPKLVKGESKVVWEWQVEGSLSSSRMRRKSEFVKSNSCEAVDVNADQNQHWSNAEPKALIF